MPSSKPKPLNDYSRIGWLTVLVGVVFLSSVCIAPGIRAETNFARFDCGGYDDHATLVNGAAWVGGVSGKALSLEGVIDCAYVSTSRVGANASKIRVIIDTDPGIDDAIALMMALRSGGLQIEAITIVAGNVESELGAQNALKILEYMGRIDIPVAVGATHPLKKPLVTDPRFHGANGLGMVSLPTPRISVIDTNAVDLIISEIMESPGEITLVTLGPLTNLAMAIEKEPAIIKNVRAVVSMAGAVYVPGFLNNNTAEFNVFTDPEAAKIVFASGIPIRMAGLEVCYKVKFTKELLNVLAGIDTHMAKLIVQMANYEVWKRSIESGYMILADPTAMAAQLQPDIFEGKAIAVDVVVSGVLEGKTIEDAVSPNKSVEILLEVDTEEVHGLLLDLARVADDVSPPMIAEIVFSPQSPTPEDLVVVSAKVTDAYSGVHVVNLLYSTSLGGSWSSLAMNRGNMTYVATIPRQADGKTVQFKISAEDDAGNTVESGITSYRVLAPLKPASISVKSLEVSKALVKSGEEVIVNATLENTGDLSGNYTLVFSLDGVQIDKSTVTIDGGKTVTKTAKLSATVEGRHQVSAGGQSATFEVEKIQPFGGIPGYPIESVALGLLLGLAYLWLYSHRMHARASQGVSKLASASASTEFSR